MQEKDKKEPRDSKFSSLAMAREKKKIGISTLDPNNDSTFEISSISKSSGMAGPNASGV